MIGQIITKLLMIWLLLVTPAHAFVEKLMPANPAQGGIPCNALGAMIFFFNEPEGPSTGVLSSIIQREWVPTGWSTQDLVDNQELIAMMNALATQAEKDHLVQSITYFCMLWELGVDEVNTASKFRTRIGIPQAP